MSCSTNIVDHRKARAIIRLAIARRNPNQSYLCRIRGARGGRRRGPAWGNLPRADWNAVRRVHALRAPSAALSTPASGLAVSPHIVNISECLSNA
ncbi:hypothetical protein WA026_003002 [Henosepilachna vigintioctopunctata]|uniref:Uncharacterized protein n=1 Tax=Henosepilachna vigintioctopunctata TaxID=420089 RepID=A0AAW1TMV0_9CUCU